MVFTYFPSCFSGHWQLSSLASQSSWFTLTGIVSPLVSSASMLSTLCFLWNYIQHHHIVAVLLPVCRLLLAFLPPVHSLPVSVLREDQLCCLPWSQCAVPRNEDILYLLIVCQSICQISLSLSNLCWLNIFQVFNVRKDWPCRPAMESSFRSSGKRIVAYLEQQSADKGKHTPENQREGTLSATLSGCDAITSSELSQQSVDAVESLANICHSSWWNTSPCIASQTSRIVLTRFVNNTDNYDDILQLLIAHIWTSFILFCLPLT